MKTRITIVILFSAMLGLVLSETLMARVVKLEWNPGLPHDTDLASYRVNRGTSPGSYVNFTSGGCLFCPAPPVSPIVVERYCLNSLPPGQTLYFAVQAVDLVGNTSQYSNEVFKTFPAATNPLGNIDVVGFSANRVDGYDLIALGATFGASVIIDCASTNWYDANAEKADLNYDGRVDGLDLIILSANFGRSA